MDIEIKEVQEIIKNLESSGELSIKEEKYLNVAKLCVQLASENVALKEACGGNGSYRNCPACTFSEYIEAPETPATDAYLAGVKADGVEEFAAHLVSMECHLEAKWAKSFVLPD
jgi:hypothetical protein